MRMMIMKRDEEMLTSSDGLKTERGRIVVNGGSK
jgi:hypothetical protein